VKLNCRSTGTLLGASNHELSLLGLHNWIRGLILDATPGMKERGDPGCQFWDSTGLWKHDDQMQRTFKDSVSAAIIPSPKITEPPPPPQFLESLGYG